MGRVRTPSFVALVAAAVVAVSAPAYATTPPTTVSGLATRPADSQVTLSWTNPADPDFAGVTVVQKDGAVGPVNVTDGTTVYDGTAASAVATGLANGSTYSFGVFTRNTAGEVSAPASVTTSPVPAPLTTLTGSVTPGTVTYGRPVAITATLRRGDTGDPISGAPVDVYRRVYGQSAFAKVYRVTTNSAGVAIYRPTPTKRTEWYVEHPADPYLGQSRSGSLTSYVAPVLVYRASSLTVEQNVASVVNATVQPSHAGQTVVMQQLVSGTWRNVAYRTLDSTSHITLRVVTATIGKRTFRLYKPSDGDHAAALTQAFTITVIPRTIRAGMSGADVMAVQRRLAALHYDVGAVNGTFGFDSVHATAAFQKVNRLPVNGTVDAATRTRLAHPVAPRLLHPQSGAWVEVDLTRQVLYYARANAVVRILDVSSGSGQLFTVDGQTQRAVTPTGTFRVLRKINGWRTSRLGQLYRPAYFAAGGYAIHGNGSVPYYPASHGCVRITIPAMDRLYSLLTIGLRVYVYRG